MPPELTTPTMQPDQLNRLALLYGRQSTLLQVRCHIGSTSRHFDLATRVLTFGWERDHMRVVDHDQGQSWASAVDRDGFHDGLLTLAWAMPERSSVWQLHGSLTRVVTGIGSWKSALSPTPASSMQQACMIRTTTMTGCCWAVQAR